MRISIVTPVLNAYGTVGEALESILGQSYSDVETIVMDGGSTDGTLDVIGHLGKRLSTVVSEADKGIYDALNKGIAAASGEVVGILHADDKLADPKVLARIASAFDDSSVEATYGDLVYVRHGDVNHVVRYWKAGGFSERRLGWGWMPPHPTLYVRRGIYDRLGCFDTSFRIAADYDLILRFLGKGRLRVQYIPHVLVRMRLGGVSNKSVKNVIRKSWEDYRALSTNGVGGIGALAWKNVSKVMQFVERPRRTHYWATERRSRGARDDQ